MNALDKLHNVRGANARLTNSFPVGFLGPGFIKPGTLVFLIAVFVNEISCYLVLKLHVLYIGQRMAAVQQVFKLT